MKIIFQTQNRSCQNFSKYSDLIFRSKFSHLFPITAILNKHQQQTINDDDDDDSKQTKYIF